MILCVWCNREMVEVDNPMRREVRHRRGQEVDCPGPAKRIVYGTRCSWWETIDKIATTYTGLPICPHCRSPLFEVESIEVWQAGVDQFDKDHPGYADMIAWSRGQCIPALHGSGPLVALRAAYAIETGEQVDL